MQHRDRRKESPSQTAGPYVHIGCTPNFSGISDLYATDLGATMKTGSVHGTEITLTGKVYDGSGTPLKDALVEIWQADAAGLFPGMEGADPNFTGWGRSPCDLDTGAFTFETVKPGQVPLGDGQSQAPHISLWIVARGINLGLNTRAYFADEDAENAKDSILAQIEDQSRVQTLLARPDGEGTDRFDIHLQGPHETVFFDV